MNEDQPSIPQKPVAPPKSRLAGLPGGGLPADEQPPSMSSTENFDAETPEKARDDVLITTVDDQGLIKLTLAGGYKHDVRPHRAEEYAATLPSDLLMSVVTLQDNIPDTLTQGWNYTCTPCAVINAVRYCTKKLKLPSDPASILFVYFNARVLEHKLDPEVLDAEESGLTLQDNGCTIFDCFESIAKYGLARDIFWPQVWTNVNRKPAITAYQDGRRQRYNFSCFQIAQKLNSLRICLSVGRPIICGFAIYESLNTVHVSQSGVVPNPKPGEKKLGDHCALLIGYNNATQVFTFQSSWSSAWGALGCGTISYEYILNPKLTTEFWTLRLSED